MFRAATSERLGAVVTARIDPGMGPIVNGDEMDLAKGVLTHIRP